MGDKRCRFLLGNHAVMSNVYEQMGAGAAYEEAVENV
jgi:hypothetical protein